jgi:hypothetical protein
VVYAFWLRGADVDTTFAVLIFSAMIGLVIGILAVSIGVMVRDRMASFVVGAVVGAVLAYGATVLTFLPLLFGGLLGFNGIDVVDDAAPVYGAAMALTGAVAGGVGTLIGNRLGVPRLNESSAA